MAKTTLWNPTGAAAEVIVNTSGYESVTLAVINPDGLASPIAISVEDEPLIDPDTGLAVELDSSAPQRVLQGGVTYKFTMAEPTEPVGLDLYAAGPHGMSG
jgi:hypothetical protein